jgi:hypothetical protein
MSSVEILGDEATLPQDSSLGATWLLTLIGVRRNWSAFIMFL